MEVYNKVLYEKAKFDPYSDIDAQFKNLLKNKDTLSLLILNKFLTKISSFEDECNKYYTMLIEMFKENINSAITSNVKNVFIVNSSIANFVKVFHNNFQPYNDKYKTVSKQLPNFLQLLFKFLKGNYVNNTIESKEEMKIIESYFIIILTFIKFYPSFLRSYQKTIEDIIQKVFAFYLSRNDITLKDIKTFLIIYSSLFYLSPSPETKLNFYLTKILANINYVFEAYKPTYIDEPERGNIPKQPDALFYEGLNHSSLIHSCKVTDLLFDIMKYLFMLIQSNSIVNVDFNKLLSLYYDIIVYYNGNNDIKAITIKGLSKSSYDIFLNNVLSNIMSSLIFFTKNFSIYISCYYTNISKIMLILLYNQKIAKKYILYRTFLSLCESIVSSMSVILPNVVDEIVYKHIYSSLANLFFEYLEKNDKTVVKLDNSYFKLGNKKKELSLIQKNHMKTDDKQYAFLENEEQKEILCAVLSLLNCYMKVEHYSVVQNAKGILSGMIDILILPCYAKFIFNIDECIKKRILNVIESSVRYSKADFNRGKLLLFMKSFYTTNEELKYQCDYVINLMSLNENDIVNYKQSGNDITTQIINYNVKVSEIIKGNIENIEKKVNNEMIGKKREKEEEIEVKPEKKKKIEVKEVKPIVKKEIKKEDKEEEKVVISREEDKNEEDDDEDINIPDFI